MIKVFRQHRKFLDEVTFVSDETTNNNRYLPDSGEVVVNETQVTIPALARNYTRSEADGEQVRVTDLEVTLLLEDINQNGISPQINDTVIYKDRLWSIQTITRDQLDVVAIIQLRSTNG